MQSTVIENDPVKAQKKATVPFLLQLSYLSSTLLSSICSDVRRIVSPDVIIQLYGFTDDWCKYFGSSEALEVSRFFLMRLQDYTFCFRNCW